MPPPVLTPDQVRAIRASYSSEGLMLADIADRYDVSIATVWRVCAGQTYRSVHGGTSVLRTSAMSAKRSAIVAARRDQGMTLSGIARELGISRQAVARYDRITEGAGPAC